MDTIFLILTMLCVFNIIAFVAIIQLWLQLAVAISRLNMIDTEYDMVLTAKSLSKSLAE
jgi:hypothetical protein